MEHVFLERGKFIRPFSRAFGIKSHCYSRPLERRITDFGADVSFARVSHKLKEHYGITVPVSAARDITEKHARAMREKENLATQIPDQDGADCIVCGVDGTMIPIVEMDVNATDQRKTRTVCWKEARLALAYPKGSVNPVFGAAIGDTEDAGDHLANCAIRAGIGEKSKVHCCGDGAPWIVEQVDRVFGTQADFLIDFYHLSGYLSAASKECAPDQPDEWLKKKKGLARESQVQKILDEIEPQQEPESTPDVDAPVRSCCRYINNRPGQFEYKKAIENDLPIGSGKVESAHRYVIQKRLKVAGAWWRLQNAHNMLALRTMRQNGDWESYWNVNDNIRLAA